MTKCARCGKTVYPTEELKCLDKSWHKPCFKCDECGMALNMKNYKGFNKTPYCSVHCPQVKPTTVVDTPETRRLAENTRLQSQVKYHQDFEKSKGKVTQVADDPETVRIRNTHKLISNVAYHGDLEKKKQMDEKRTQMPNEASNNGPSNTTSIANSRSTNGVQSSATPVRKVTAVGNSTNVPQQSVHGGQTSVHQSQQPQKFDPSNSKLESHDSSLITSVRGINRDFNENRQQSPARATKLTSAPVANSIDHNNKSSPVKQSSSNIIYNSQGLSQSVQDANRKIGSIADYDPLNDNYGSIATGIRGPEQVFAYYGPSQGIPQQQHQQQLHHQQQMQQMLYQQANNQAYHLQQHQQQQQHLQQQQQQMQYQRQLAAGQHLVHPMSAPNASMIHPSSIQASAAFNQHQQPQLQQLKQLQLQQQQQQMYLQKQAQIQHQQLLLGQQQLQRQQQAALAKQSESNQSPQFVVRAIYDYSAKEGDEVSFLDGDVIIACVPIDEGWMTGTVQRTGDRGMLPANYVERVQL